MTENQTTDSQSLPRQNRQGYSERARALEGYFQEAELELLRQIQSNQPLDPRGRVLKYPASPAQASPPSSPPLVGLSGSGPLPSELSNVSHGATGELSEITGGALVGSRSTGSGSPTADSTPTTGLTPLSTQPQPSEPIDTAATPLLSGRASHE